MDIAQQIAADFGLEWPKFIAQVIVFGAVFAILKWKAFGPVTAMLEMRRKRIEEGEANLEKIRVGVEQAKARADEIEAEANENAERLVAEARESVQKLTEQKTHEATLEASQIIAKAREASELEKAHVMTELKSEFGRLVISTTSQVTGKVLTEDDQQKINQEALGQIGNN